jgi:luciferase family oxidoreductase group 1
MARPHARTPDTRLMTRLRLGIVDQVPVPNGSTAADAVGNTLTLARAADALGYSRYWLAEHHSTNSFACAAPEALISQVATVTERMRVGSGGVMLSHYSPFKVAEQFRMLTALHPGRIDLGVGRAPGGTHRAVQALEYGRPAIPLQQFPQQLDDLLQWLGDGFGADHPWRKVRAMPRVQEQPEVWVLGSGGESAFYAAERGCGYSFAQFISGVDGAALTRAYRERFQPSESFPQPRASLGIGVICAETQAEAERLALSMHLWRWRIIRGQDRGIPSPRQAETEFAEAGVPLPELLRDDPRTVVGDPQQVRDELLRLAEHYGVDEIMTVTVTHDPAARLRSYELLAEAMTNGAGTE